MGKRREKLQDSSHCLEIFILQMYIVHIIDNLTLSYGYNYFKICYLINIPKITVIIFL